MRPGSTAPKCYHAGPRPLNLIPSFRVSSIALDSFNASASSAELDSLDRMMMLSYPEPMTTWQVQTAKQRFSEVVRAAESGEPQFITKHGKTVAVVVDIEDYRRTHESEPAFGQFLLALSEIGLEEGLDPYLPSREVDPERLLDLFAEDVS